MEDSKSSNSINNGLETENNWLIITEINKEDQKVKENYIFELEEESINKDKIYNQK